MLRKIRYSEERRIRKGEVEKEKKRVNIAGVEQAVFQRKKEEEKKKRERYDVRAFSRKAFFTSVSYLL
jgi:hypothetical protein